MAGELSASQIILASGSGAVLTSLLMTPLDHVKTRLHSQLHRNVCETRKLRGTKHALVVLAKTEGVPSLWRGLPPVLALSIPGTCVYYHMYETLKNSYENHGLGSMSSLLAGSSARTLAAVTVSPLELVRTNAQACQGLSGLQLYQEIGKRMTVMVRQNGPKSLWKGLIPTLWRDVPFSAIYWWLYEGLKAAASDNMKASHAAFLCGAASGTVAAMITNPFDVAKTHRQMIMTGQVSASASGTPDIIRNIVRRHGWRGLFAGLGPRIAKVAPACGVMIGTYETAKQYFATRNRRGY